jgi:hypothetical protein
MYDLYKVMPSFLNVKPAAHFNMNNSSQTYSKISATLNIGTYPSSMQPYVFKLATVSGWKKLS